MEREQNEGRSLHTGKVPGSIPGSPTMPPTDFIEKSGASHPEKEVHAGSGEPVADMLAVLERLIAPPPGVQRLPPWAYGLIVPAIARAKGGGDE